MRAIGHVALVSVAASLVVFATHDFGYLLTWPLWGDEAWVAISRKFPLSDLPSLISSTPIGWNLLVQGFAVLGDGGGRILVQLFNVGSVVVAYFVGRAVLTQPSAIPRVIAGIFVGLAFAVSPATLTRVDLKHYTADAFVALVVLLIVIKQVRRPSRSGLVVLTMLSAIALSMSLGAIFVVAAGFGSLAIHRAVSRDWLRLRETVVGAAIAGIGIVAWYLAFYTRGDIPALRQFWAPQYPQSLVELPRFLGARLIAADEQTVYRVFWVIVPLLLIGTILLWRRRDFALASYVPAMLSVMIALGLLQRYPLLDVRTSHFFFMTVSVMCAVSTIVIAEWLGARLARVKSGAARRVPIVITSVAVSVIVVLAAPLYRSHSLPSYDVGNQLDYVSTHMRDGDLILFNQLASYQVGMAWKRDEPSWCPNDQAWTGFDICYPGVNDLKPFFSLDDAYSMIDHRLEQYPGSRVWLVRSHVFLEYEQMERDLPAKYRYQVIDLPIQPVGVVDGFRPLAVREG